MSRYNSKRAEKFQEDLEEARYEVSMSLMYAYDEEVISDWIKTLRGNDIIALAAMPEEVAEGYFTKWLNNQQ